MIKLPLKPVQKNTNAIYPPVPKWPPQKRYEIGPILIEADGAFGGKLGIELRGTQDNIQRLVIHDVYADGAAYHCKPALHAMDWLVKCGTGDLKGHSFSSSIDIIMGEVKRLKGRVPVYISRQWNYHDIPIGYDPIKYQQLKKQHDIEMKTYKKACVSIDRKHGDDYNSRMEDYNKKIKNIIDKNKKIKLLQIKEKSKMDEIQKKEQLEKLNSIEYLKVQQDMKILCHLLPCEIFMTIEQQNQLQRILNNEQEDGQNKIKEEEVSI